jgi:hypothetical protein
LDAATTKANKFEFASKVADLRAKTAEENLSDKTKALSDSEYHLQVAITNTKVDERTIEELEKKTKLDADPFKNWRTTREFLSTTINKNSQIYTKR